MEEIENKENVVIATEPQPILWNTRAMKEEYKKRLTENLLNLNRDKPIKSLRHLARETGMQYTTVLRHLKEMDRLGVLRGMDIVFYNEDRTVVVFKR